MANNDESNNSDLAEAVDEAALNEEASRELAAMGRGAAPVHVRGARR